MSTVSQQVALMLGRTISVRLEHIGLERQPLMIVDNVLQDPRLMVDAARATAFYVPEHTNYPGINARLPEAYYQAVIMALRGPLEAAFGLPRSAHLSYFGFFALATTSARDARAIQRIPHRDSTNPDRLAMVHYLCHGQFGGTGFFRHRSTGFESVDASREPEYVSAAKGELENTAASDVGFASERTLNYELIGQSPAVFNRVIVYRSHVLHSALLDDDAGSTDAARGRLTANGFVEERSG
jgi:hypothetical protein